jgi:hypothetical protein
MASKAPGYTKQLVLAVLLFVFGSFAYWLEYSKKPKEEAAKADEKKIFALKDTQIRRLEIEGVKPVDPTAKDAKKVEPYLLDVALECQSLADKLCKTEDASRWELAEPLRARADDATVNGLLKNYGNLTTSESIDLSTDTPEKRATLLSDYGLSAERRKDPKTRKIRLFLADGTVRTAYFGEKHPLSDGSFAIAESGKEGASTVDEAKVFVVPEWQISVFDQKTSYFRDKKLIGGNERDVASFTVSLSKKNPGAKIEGTKDAAGKWKLRSGANEFEGDVDAIESVLSGASQLAAKDFIAEKKDDANGKRALAGARPIYDLVMRLKNTEPKAEKRLRLFEKAGPKVGDQPGRTIYATVDGLDPLFEIEVSNADRLDVKLEELRLKRLIAVMDRYGINAIAAESRGKKAWKASVKKSGNDWVTDEVKPLGKTKVDAILDRLSSPSIKAFTGPAPTGETVVLRFATPEKSLDQGGTYEVEFWKKENRLFARDLRAARKEVVELPGDFASQLPWDEGFLKNP